jgi:hypothetical protein
MAPYSVLRTAFIFAATALTLSALPSLATSEDKAAVQLIEGNFSGEVDADKRPVQVRGSNCQVAVSGTPIEVNVEGSNNNVKVPAGCTLIKVTGSNNSVDLGLAREIIIFGSNNNVRWAKTATGKPPLVKNVGSNNAVVKVKSER